MLAVYVIVEEGWLTCLRGLRLKSNEVENHLWRDAKIFGLAFGFRDHTEKLSIRATELHHLHKYINNSKGQTTFRTRHA